MHTFTPSTTSPYMPGPYFSSLALSFATGVFLAMWLCRAKPHAAARIAAVGQAVAAGEGQMKMTLVVRKDLKMSTGKISAQCAHSAVGVVDHVRYMAPDKAHQPQWAAWLDAWSALGSMKVVLKVDSEDALLAVAKAGKDAGVPTYVVRDAGRTQIAAGSRTVLAVGPAPKALVDSITGSLPLL
jgi:PTH2 family peptidyl-tRNA hydrolase